MTIKEMMEKLAREVAAGNGDKEVRVAVQTGESEFMEGREVSLEWDQTEEDAGVLYVSASERRESFISRGVKENDDWVEVA